jgi:DNA-binding response OmpR family regulator
MKGPQIIIIEDNESIRKLLYEALKNFYAVELAADAEAGLKLIEQKCPDLILLDLMLPGLSGLEFCSLLRNHTSYRHIPIIALSARTGSRARTTAYGIGFNNYLEKPFELAELGSIIKATLNMIMLGQEAPLIFQDLVLDQQQRSLTVKQANFQLTPREFDVLSLLMRNANRIISRQQLLENVAAPHNDTADRNLDNFISSLRRKLVQSEVKITTHYSVGYEMTKKAAA